MKTGLRVGLDLGGSKLLGLVVSDGDILKQDKRVLPKLDSPADLIQFIARFYKFLIESFSGNGFPSIGLALPSPVNIQTGVALSLTAYGWKNIPVRDLLEKQMGIKVLVENDVNAATLAEYKLGAGQGAESLFTFYPGTGLGGGFISNGQLVRGLNGTAGEVGHMVIQMDGPECSCGQRGCLEAIVSNHGIRNLIKKRNAGGRDSSLPVDGKITGEDLVRGWRAKNPLVRELLTYQARALGIGVANVINITGVERIIIGGVVFHQLEEDLFPIIRKAASRYSIGEGMNQVEIRVNVLGENAPALGMTVL